jgi:hypothetical protein
MERWLLTVAFFWCTSSPRRPLPLTMQYGMSFLRSSAGSHTTWGTHARAAHSLQTLASPIQDKRLPHAPSPPGLGLTSSMGLTSWAMATRRTCFFSIRSVTCFRPNFSTFFFVFFGASPLAFCSASCTRHRPRTPPLQPTALQVHHQPRRFLPTCSRRFFLASLSSGLYLAISLKSSVAWFLSRALENWLMEGGTFRRWCRICHPTKHDKPHPALNHPNTPTHTDPRTDPLGHAD